jgi:hypothetical protein
MSYKEEISNRQQICRRLVFFRLAGPFRTRCPGGPTVSIAFWSKFSPFDFNRDFAACLIFLPCTTSPAIFNPVFKASRSRVFAPHGIFIETPLHNETTSSLRYESLPRLLHTPSRERISDICGEKISLEDSLKQPCLYREFNPFLTYATQSETYSPAGNIACLNPNMDCIKGLMMI